MISIVNGYVCRSGCDEAVAKKGRDPRNPSGDPVRTEMLAQRDGKTDVAGSTDAKALSFGKDQSSVSAGPSSYAARDPARLVDLYA